MGRLKLELTSKRDLWTIDVLHGTESDSNPKIKEIRKVVLKRDNYTCQCCGWRSRYYQELHHINHDHDDYSIDNLATVCPLCHQIYHLPTISSLKGGEMIWMPEISQEKLNIICLNLFLAMENPTLKEMAEQIYLVEFERRKQFVDSYLGRDLGGSDPGVFAETMIEMEKDKKVIDNIRKNIKVLPAKTRFQPYIDQWVKEFNIKDKNTYFSNFEKNKYGEMLLKMKEQEIIGKK